MHVHTTGPNEPQGSRRDSKNSVFASHYDTGRITYCSGTNPVSPRLNQRSINRYRQIESESGISFFNPVGFIAIGTKDSEFIRVTEKCLDQFKIEAEILDSNQLTDKFPYLTIPSNYVGIYQPEKAGYIDIRRCVQAQIKVAQLQGCIRIAEIVESIVENKDGKLKISTETGRYITADKIVLATGAFTKCKDLMASWNRKLDLDVRRETTVKLQVNAKGLQDLSTMPSLIYADATEPRHVCYILPPIKYNDDGVYYLKIGHGLHYSKKIDPENLVQWYHGSGDPDAETSLKQILKKLIPHDYFTASKCDSCAIARTPHRSPMIDKVGNNVTILVGGNGGSAKSCNEIGYIGALNVLHRKWHYDIPASVFQVCYEENESKL
ncbi:Monomeric sarcosine oxidase [Trichoplax sp. H2]|nr:Monomeric sarcosine oxidase [Trichoplax sp. H2]|eukprot:RDD36960.1 Monomeric sarcosine oxidase [Trichoplax sp. H2]